VTAIACHFKHLHGGRAARVARTERATHELGLIFKDALQQFVFRGIEGTGKHKEYIRQIVAGERDPYSIVDEILASTLKVPAKDA
jgi:hypothetical protein